MCPMGKLVIKLVSAVSFATLILGLPDTREKLETWRRLADQAIDALNPETWEYRIVLEGTLDKEDTKFEQP